MCIDVDLILIHGDFTETSCVAFLPLKVWTCFFYMGRFGGASPKRHRLWSNDPDLLSSIVGRAGYMSKQEMEQCVFRIVRKYVDGNGVKQHVGNKEVLCDSQCLRHVP